LIQPVSSPPVAARKPHRYTHHGVTLDDPYHWLKDPGYPKVEDAEILAYLRAENDYFQAAMAPLSDLTQELFEEIKGRQQQDESSVPYREGNYEYQWKFTDGAQYPSWWRWPLGDADSAVKIIDEPALAGNSEYFRLGGFSVSPAGRYLAYSVDTNGSERYVLRIKDLEDDSILDEVIEETLGAPTWANESTFFYPVLNENWRPHQIKRHELGAIPADDPVIYQEPGEFFVGVGRTQSARYIVVSASDHVTSEVRVLSVDNPHGALQLISPRRTGHEYHVEHHGEQWFILSNDTHKNFRIAVAPHSMPGEDNWETLVAGDDTHYLRGVTCFDELMVIEERIAGLDQIRLRDYSGVEHYIEFPESVYHAGLGTNVEYAIDALRIGYESMISPRTVFDYPLNTSLGEGELGSGQLVTRKVQQIPSGYDSSRYVTQRLTARARDGKEIPVSIVYSRDFKRDADTPLYLYGYGAYGAAIPPGFSTTRLSLLERGFAFAIAHIRGGDDLGYAWYEDGKLEHRENTFNDFVDVARWLLESGYAGAGRIAIGGGSAGGELMGAVVNQAPELWGVVTAHVPFVDVLNTMLDPDLPLTPNEWPEWGNPIEDPEAFATILAYSPYDQLEPGAFPPMLVTAGLNDPRVTYWEPAKYVAKLRTLKTDGNPLLLKVNMGAGHGGKSGRFDALYEVAEEYAFVLNALGLG
jgi:oligopeptidase B